MKRSRSTVRVLACVLLAVTALPAAASDSFQRTIAITEAFVPLGLLLAQGTDTPLEIAAFGGSLALQTVPNVMMLMAQRARLPRLSRTLRLVNFGIDCAIGAGALGVGAALLAGAFGDTPDRRMLGGLYLALSIPAGFAAYADTVPYTAEGP